MDIVRILCGLVAGGLCILLIVRRRRRTNE